MRPPQRAGSKQISSPPRENSATQKASFKETSGEAIASARLKELSEKHVVTFYRMFLDLRSAAIKSRGIA
jgi:hypothetical protein